MSARFSQLRVVTSARWLVGDLAAAQVVPVVADLGLDVPADTTGVAWWCPARHAARLAATGRAHVFTAPDANWQADLLSRAGRPTVAARLADLPGGLTGRVFAKVADVKHPRVPARVWADVADFAAAATGAGIPGGAWCLLTPVVTTFTAEHRCFVTGGQVVAASVYLADGCTWDHWPAGAQPGSGDAARFAQDVVDDLPDQPPGWVLDVGVDTAGRWQVVEANPAWCANPYHADPSGVVHTVLASQDPATAAGWVWDMGAAPGAWRRPLPVRGST